MVGMECVMNVCVLMWGVGDILATHQYLFAKLFIQYYIIIIRHGYEELWKKIITAVNVYSLEA